MADRNNVTEKQVLPNTFWVVTSEWRGGHNQRKIQLENIHYSEKAALADWEKQTKEKHNSSYNLELDYDSGFVRHPLRKFTAEVVECLK
jgi:hypothetical protein